MENKDFLKFAKEVKGKIPRYYLSSKFKRLLPDDELRQSLILNFMDLNVDHKTFNNFLTKLEIDPVLTTRLIYIFMRYRRMNVFTNEFVKTYGRKFLINYYDLIEDLTLEEANFINEHMEPEEKRTWVFLNYMKDKELKPKFLSLLNCGFTITYLCHNVKLINLLARIVKNIEPDSIILKYLTDNKEMSNDERVIYLIAISDLPLTANNDPSYLSYLYQKITNYYKETKSLPSSSDIFLIDCLKRKTDTIEDDTYDTVNKIITGNSFAKDKLNLYKLKMIARLMETSYEEVSKPALAKKRSNLKDSPDSYIKDLILSERRNKIQRLVELINQYEDNACPPIRELTINQK